MTTQMMMAVMITATDETAHLPAFQVRLMAEEVVAAVEMVEAVDLPVDLLMEVEVEVALDRQAQDLLGKDKPAECMKHSGNRLWPLTFMGLPRIG
ncbi:hypothetical protein BSKO_06238 [Bryopsis sp. KO-2023]|nr:hypothetical protein BSKO_06238 [Bryopsis sp. KO-2023]